MLITTVRMLELPWCMTAILSFVGIQGCFTVGRVTTVYHVFADGSALNCGILVDALFTYICACRIPESRSQDLSIKRYKHPRCQPPLPGQNGILGKFGVATTGISNVRN